MMKTRLLRAVIALTAGLALTLTCPSQLSAQTPGQLVPSAPLVSSAAYEASHVLKAGGGTLLFLAGFNSGPAQFIQLHNAAATPAAGAVPAVTFYVPASSNFSLAIPLSGMPFRTGIVVCNSSTGATQTAGSADCFFSGVVK